MNYVKVPTTLNSETRRYRQFKDDYKLDMWSELKKRWLIFGVLFSILLAVLSPSVGAPGGPLHSEYALHLPLAYIYYRSGRRVRARAWPTSARACVLAAAHAHVVAPVLCALAAKAAAEAGLHRTVVKGALLCSAGGPCAWLSLCVTRDTAAAALLLAASHVASLVAAPVALYIICGRAPIPALGPSIWSALCILPPFAGGMLYTHTRTHSKHNQDPTCAQDCTQCLCEYTQFTGDCAHSVCECTQLIGNCAHSLCECALLTNCTHGCMVAVRLCALVLLYFDCCERLREAEGSLHVMDVLGTLVFACSYVCLSLAACRAYAHALGGPRASTLAVCALPKALHTGWELSTACVPAGLARLPAVFIAPAQALLLAALADYTPGVSARRRALPK